MSTKALREELKVKLQTVCSEAHEQKGNEKRIGAGFVDVYGPQARASVSIKKDNLRLLDVQHLLTWIYADSIAPNWIFLKNKPLLKQTVVVAVPGLDKETQQSSAARMAQTSKALGAPVSCRIDDGKASFASSLDRLLHVQSKKSNKRAKPPAGPPTPPESYALSLATMHKMEYPMPVLGPDNQLQPPDGYTWTGGASFSSAGQLPEELRVLSTGASELANASDNHVLDNQVLQSTAAPVLSEPQAGSAPEHRQHLSLEDGELSESSGDPETRPAPAKRARHGKSGTAPDPPHKMPLQAKSIKVPMYGLDCEMCITREGMEVTRISMVDAAGKCVFDELVLPHNPITDYNTQYSGITAAMLDGVTMRRADAVERMKTLLGTDALLVGHGLENDLRALRLLHGRVLDTADLFPHPRGLPSRCALRNLTHKYLHRTIQSGAHDSVDDARAAMELALLKVKHGPEFGTPQGRLQQGMQLTTMLAQHNLRSCFIDRPSTVQRYVKGNSSGITVTSDIQAVKHMAKEAQGLQEGGAVRHHVILTRLVGLPSMYAEAVEDMKKEFPNGVSTKPAQPSGRKKGNRKDTNPPHDLPEFKMPPGRIDAELDDLDQHLGAVWDSLNSNTMMIVVSLGGNTMYTRWIYELRCKRNNGCEGYPPWTEACEDHYQKCLERSIRGCLWCGVKP